MSTNFNFNIYSFKNIRQRLEESRAAHQNKIRCLNPQSCIEIFPECWENQGHGHWPVHSVFAITARNRSNCHPSNINWLDYSLGNERHCHAFAWGSFSNEHEPWARGKSEYGCSIQQSRSTQIQAQEKLKTKSEYQKQHSIKNQWTRKERRRRL